MDDDKSTIQKSSHGRLLLPSLVFSYFATSPPGILTGLLLIDISIAFECSVGIAGQLNTLSGIAAVVFALLMGILSVRFTHKSLLLMGLLFLNVSTLGCTLAPNFSLMLISYSLLGLATAEGINHSVIRTNYGHTEDIARFRDYMMPFFWEIFNVDTTMPNITNVVQDPLIDILPDTVVKINATVTDATSEMKQVTLNYTTGNGTWITAEMTNLEEDIWNATIPALPYGTNVTYMIVAEDVAGNTITTEQVYGYRYEYPVVPEFPSFLIAPLFMIATLLAIIVYKKKRIGIS